MKYIILLSLFIVLKYTQLKIAKLLYLKKASSKLGNNDSSNTSIKKSKLGLFLGIPILLFSFVNLIYNFIDIKVAFYIAITLFFSLFLLDSFLNYQRQIVNQSKDYTKFYLLYTFINVAFLGTILILFFNIYLDYYL